MSKPDPSYWTDPQLVSSSRTPVGFALGGLEPRVQWIDGQWESRQWKLKRTFAERSVELFLTSRDGRRVVVAVSDPSYPPVYHLVDFDCSSATMLGCVRRQYGEDSDTWPYRKEQLGPVTDPALALDAAGKSYRYVRLPGEDHWLSSSETRIQVLTELESFLERSVHSACSISEQK